jgi:uncharacterized protein (TIGR02246 family)
VTEDRDPIRRTLAEYCQLLDDGRFDQWAELFTEDARLVLLGRVTTGRGAILDYMKGVQPDGSRGLHMTANSVVDADGDSATATTDYMFVRHDGGGLHIIAAGHYHDRLVRDSTRWRFSERKITMLTAPENSDG